MLDQISSKVHIKIAVIYVLKTWPGFCLDNLSSIVLLHFWSCSWRPLLPGSTQWYEVEFFYQKMKKWIILLRRGKIKKKRSISWYQVGVICYVPGTSCPVSPKLSDLGKQTQKMHLQLPIK